MAGRPSTKYIYPICPSKQFAFLPSMVNGTDCRLIIIRLLKSMRSHLSGCWAEPERLLDDEEGSYATPRVTLGISDRGACGDKGNQYWQPRWLIELSLYYHCNQSCHINDAAGTWNSTPRISHSLDTTPADKATGQGRNAERLVDKMNIKSWTYKTVLLNTN